MSYKACELPADSVELRDALHKIGTLQSDEVMCMGVVYVLSASFIGDFTMRWQRRVFFITPRSLKLYRYAKRYTVQRFLL